MVQDTNQENVEFRPSKGKDSLDKYIVKDNGDVTSCEQHEILLKQLEKDFETGPIISPDIRDLIFSSLTNVMLLQMILRGFGLGEEEIMALMEEGNKFIMQRDREILEKRAKNVKTN